MGNEEEKRLQETNEIIHIMQRIQKIDPNLSDDIINYVFSHLDTPTLRGKINFNEYSIALEKSVVGLYELVYLKNYGRDLTNKRILTKSGSNLIFLLYTRVLNGLDFELLKKELESKQPMLLKTS